MRIKNMFSLLVCVLTMGVLGFGGYTFFKDMNGPSIVLFPDTGRVSPTREMKLSVADVSGVRSVVVAVRKNNSSTVVYKKHFSPYRAEENITFSLKDAGIREGAFDLEVKATDASLAGFGQGNTRTQVWPMRMDTQPPRIAVKTIPPHVRRGGTGVIRYTVNEETMRSGVRVGKLFFPGYLQQDNTYICFFAFPQTLEVAQYVPEIMAEDLAGNITISRLMVRALDRAYKKDTITVTDDFLNKVSQVLFELAPDATTPLERFLTINKDIRTANVQFLMDQGQETEPTMLWRGIFARLPRSAARANFGDHRTYIYQGQKIDDQYHLGLDLASLIHADVPAANNGRVIFSGYLGIYGNVLIIDHGLGLMSVYSHLSAYRVRTGDVVTKGDIIANTGNSGMAFGDHLHFGMLVGGVEVNPIEWLDAKWIKDNVIDRLAQAN